MSEDSPIYQKPEDKVRHEKINPLLDKAGWKIQNYKVANPHSSKGVAVEYFQIGKDQADYILFVNRQAVGVIEAKKPGETLTGKEKQTGRYSEDFPEEFDSIELPLPFLYESNGHEHRFTNLWDPKPRSREIFAFHKPETFEEWIVKGKKENLRFKLAKNPQYENKGLWHVQKKAITGVKESLVLGKPKALIQMATGSGKTFVAVNLCYYLIKHCGAKRILFLVDRGNLGNQTRQEFENFEVPEDGRKFTDIYNVQHLNNNKIVGVNRVVISTIQRMYSILQGEKELDPEKENDESFMGDPTMQVEALEYNKNVPIEEFDFVIVDECHRSIYNLWKQVLDYFDSFMIGLTATPSKSTIGFFDSNLVMEYTHEEAVADQVNVDFTVYNIRTKITKFGSIIEKGETILKRDLRTRKKRWYVLEDEVQYGADKLDKAVVAKDQIRKIIRTFKEKLFTEIFKDRRWVPKTLIYAKDDNHADEIVKIVREEFNEGNDFAVKITYKTEGDKDALLRSFRNSPNPRIAVTVDMIATGTDIKPLEIVFFMRPVRSRLYFEQMKGRGVRVMKNDDFKSVTPDAMAKERFVIIDAVGVCENEGLNETRPLEQMPHISFEKLLKFLQYGKPKREHLSSMASRLSRLQKRLTETQIKEIKTICGNELPDYSKGFVTAIDEDKILEEAQKKFGERPKKEEIEKIASERMKIALQPFIGNMKLMTRLPELKKEVEQIIDIVSIDVVEEAGHSKIATEKAKKTVDTFREFIKKNKSELVAIQIFYENKGRLNWKDIKQLSEKIRSPPFVLTTSILWQAYKRLEEKKVRGNTNNKRITDFISLLKYEIQKTSELEPYLDTVDKRFSEWLGTQREQGVSFNQEQLNWLEKIKNHIAATAEIEADDFELGELQQMGGLGKAVKTFGQERFNQILVELNERVGG